MRRGNAFAVCNFRIRDVNAKRARRAAGQPLSVDTAPVPKSVQVAFGRKVRTLREAAGMSQAELAKLVGMVQTKLPAIEQGRRDIRLSTIERFARALNVPIKDLLDHD